MRFSLLPTVMAHSVTDLTPKLLEELGIDLLMLDFDNTIVPYTTNEPTEKMAKWLKQMGESSVRLCVVSNSKRNRVKVFCKAYGLECITHARKPFSKGILACLEKFGVPKSRSALAGDQIYTDVLGANSAGIRSILVTAIDNHNCLLKARHVLELPWILAAGKRRITHE